MLFDHTIEIEGTEVKMCVEGTGAMNGIGAYEFWGARCYDHGSFEFEEFVLISVDKPEYKQACEDWVANDANFDKMSELGFKKMEDDAADVPDYDEPEYD